MRTLFTRMVAFLPVLGLLVFYTAASAQESVIEGDGSRIYVKKVEKPLPEVYSKVFTALENGGYFVQFEPNIAKNLEHFAQRWGDDYNRNKLEAIRSLVFSNAWYVNQISNLDPELLAMVPLRMTFIHKEEMTTMLFVRPSRVAADSPAKKIATELENDIINTIERIVFY
ncbi:DUF302 domain-containing protein [Thiohalophilus thiocyanatoxydans]|uniref:Uncharacterized protein DUF302 n=1 Tax=Thiohalophilus thiocyanatoxydans TaxID=381308 RepID=A0A4R8III7_9GAMM|nr:DUF302 domain-containing protein [Thiohalophilus thiocyanatoxydans]TDY00098.1 uncharacterized protein DUF302 [Thiohalophilus thiocyanatoxydans]